MGKATPVAKVGDKVLYCMGDKHRRAEVTQVHDDGSVDLNIYGGEDTVASHNAGPGAIIGGKSGAKAAANPSEAGTDGYWSPLP